MTHSHRAARGETMWHTPGLGDVPTRRARRRRRAVDETRADARVAIRLILVLAVVGAALGPLWAKWSGAQQRAYVIAPGKLYPYEEVEKMAATDGRYLAIVAAVGFLAALFAWLFRASHRGPLVLLGLGVGGAVGSALTWFTGYLTGGGTYHGKAGSQIAHLPVSLHMRGLLFVEPAIAIMIYGLFVAFAVRDDLGRADPVRERLVRARTEAQDGWRYGDGAGALQQRDLPPQ
ncbi:MAG TPA: hypothetical protein VE442_01795 [Jatrophihabitans sp.]|jgi:hypothetical protein|nr:hypothetical protein [Jatrophihabitans sp.]